MRLRSPAFIIVTLLVTTGCSSLATQRYIPPTSQDLSSSQFCSQLFSRNDPLVWDSLSDNHTDTRMLWENFDERYVHTEGKRSLVVFIDGTNNTKKSNTNIWKLYTLATEHACAGERIVPYYREGVGAGFGSRVLGAVTGLGTDSRIKAAYQFLVDTYEQEDEIFIFGFSRGAYIARSLNGFIEFAGLLKNESDDESIDSKIDNLYKVYKTPNDGEPRFEDRLYADMQKANTDYAVYRCAGVDVSEQFPRFSCGDKVKVKAIGVFDTVPALGLSRDDYPDDHRTNLFADRGYHLLSIDEQRNDFRPLRFDSRILIEQELEEVWFAGAHADVGGGYTVTTPAENDKEMDDNAGLQWVTRKWMMRKFKDYNLFASEPSTTALAYENDSQELPILALGELHDEFLDKKLFAAFGIHWRMPLKNDNIHCSVVERLEALKLPKPLKTIELGGVYRPENIYQLDVHSEANIKDAFNIQEIRKYYTIVGDSAVGDSTTDCANIE